MGKTTEFVCIAKYSLGQKPSLGRSCQFRSFLLLVKESKRKQRHKTKIIIKARCFNTIFERPIDKAIERCFFCPNIS